MAIIVPPSTLILQLKNFLLKKTKYQLNAVVNDIGETTSSGHYNILLHDKNDNRFILVDVLEIRNNPVLDEMNSISYVIVYTRQ